MLVLTLALIANTPVVECLGPKDAKHALIYLHGMDTEPPGEQEQHIRQTLAVLAKALSIRIALPRAQTPCPTNPALRCWGWEFNDASRLTATLPQPKDIKRCFASQQNPGLLGFSNGSPLGLAIDLITGSGWALTPENVEVALSTETKPEEVKEPLAAPPADEAENPS